MMGDFWLHVDWTYGRMSIPSGGLDPRLEVDGLRDELRMGERPER